MNPDEIKKIRDKTKLTQEQFASIMGITSGTVNRWENGKAKPSRLAIARLQQLIKDREL